MIKKHAQGPSIGYASRARPPAILTVLLGIVATLSISCRILGASVIPDGYTATWVVTPDGKYLVVENRVTHSLQVIDPQSWSVRESLPLNYELYRLLVSPDGRYLVGYDGATVIVWSTGNWQEVCSITGALNSRTGTRDIAIFQDESLFVVVDTGADIYRLAKGKYVKAEHISANFGQTCSELSRDGRFLACGGHGFLKIWDTRTWRPVRRFYGKWKTGEGKMSGNDSVDILRFSPKNDLLLAGGDSSVAHVFDTENWAQRDNKQQFTFARNAVSFIHYTDTDGSTKTLTTKYVDGGVMDASFSSDGRTLATVSWQAKFWDTRTGKPIGPTSGIDTLGTNVIFLPKRNEVVTLNERGGLTRCPVPAAAP